MKFRHQLIAFAFPLLCTPTLNADGPADNQAASVRPVPPPGVEISEVDRIAIETSLAPLAELIQELGNSKHPFVIKYLPDAEVFLKAVKIALAEDGFFEPKDVASAKASIQEGISRAEFIRSVARDADIRTPDSVVPIWASVSSGPAMTVRGFRSRLDGSVQPYGVVFGNVAFGKRVDLEKPISQLRADIWCRGRSEKGLELQFIATRMGSTDPMPVPGSMMIHPFGRYCNANKLAGEVDTLEALEHALQSYPIDSNRVAIRGFSMGGAAAWHLAVHYPDKWFAANPGAGFSETPDFLKVFQSEDLIPAWYEKKLWQMYDCPVWVRNLKNLPTIAYSGELDKQKQAADIMAAASWNLPELVRFELAHVVAPKTGHSVSPEARMEIERRLALLDPIDKPKLKNNLSFTTTTLKYNKSNWLTVNAISEHWRPAHFSGYIDQLGVLHFEAENIIDLSIAFDVNDARCNGVSAPGLSRIPIVRRSDSSSGIRLRFDGKNWVQVSPIAPPMEGLQKRHGLQGPIDDAFMGPFLFVKPVGAGRHPSVDKWVEAEFQRAVREWHRQMRGDVRIKSAEELTADDIEKYNLILWGDPKSNSILSKVIEKLPIQWRADQIVVAKGSFDSKSHVPVLIYPNPLNPDRYIVLNSGITYREYDYLNNARQVPKLPDWAIVDFTTPPNARWPGKIAAADFFDEQWELKSSVEQPGK